MLIWKNKEAALDPSSKLGAEAYHEWGGNVEQPGIGTMPYVGVRPFAHC